MTLVLPVLLVLAANFSWRNGQPLVKERFFARACLLTLLLERVNERVASLPVLLETALSL